MIEFITSIVIMFIMLYYIFSLIFVHQEFNTYDTKLPKWVFVFVVLFCWLICPIILGSKLAELGNERE